MIQQIIKFGIILFVLISFFSCANKYKDWEKEVKSVDDMLRVFDKEIKLNAEIYIRDTVHLLNPFDIEVVNDYFIVQEQDNPAEGVVSVYDMSNKELLGKMFHHGYGPNDLLGLRMNLYGKDTLLALDPYKNTAQLFGLNELKACNGIPARVINYQLPNKKEQIDHSYLIGDKLLCSGQFQKGRFQVYDTRGKYLYEFEKFPKVNEGVFKLDNIQLGSLFGASSSFHDNSKLSKMACLTTGSLIIYDYNIDQNDFKRDFFAQWKFTDITQARYINDKPFVMGDQEKVMVGAGDLAANDKHLFISFSELRRVDTTDDNCYNYILVTNWKGKPVAKLVLDKPIHFPLYADSDGKYIYAIHTNITTGFSEIIRYDISSL